MTLRSHYHPEHYDLSRPIYPIELFDPVKGTIGRVLPASPVVLDLGCGTGLVWNSISTWALGMEWVLLDPNAALLETAVQKMKPLHSSQPFSVTPLCAAAEAIPLADDSVDLILCGSAWHWFKPAALREVARILRAAGAIYIFEYQFPKLEQDPHHLNEWVRRQFNESWRFTDQAPRGYLFEMTAGLRVQPEFSQTRFHSLQRSLPHSAEFFTEVIFSQARYLDFELRNGKEKALDLRQEVFRGVLARFPDPETAAFAYRFEGLLFQKRQV
jgi:ubiquinone/menaquinone biosynthesis C-methylase UbiE